MENITKIFKRLFSIFLEVMENQKPANLANRTREDYMKLIADHSNSYNANDKSNEDSRKDSLTFDIYMSNFSFDQDIGSDYLHILEEKDHNNEAFHNFVIEVKMKFLQKKFFFSKNRRFSRYWKALKPVA